MADATRDGIRRAASHGVLVAHRRQQQIADARATAGIPLSPEEDYHTGELRRQLAQRQDQVRDVVRKARSAYEEKDQVERELRAKEQELVELAAELRDAKLQAITFQRTAQRELQEQRRLQAVVSQQGQGSLEREQELRDELEHLKLQHERTQQDITWERRLVEKNLRCAQKKEDTLKQELEGLPMRISAEVQEQIACTLSNFEELGMDPTQLQELAGRLQNSPAFRDTAGRFMQHIERGLRKADRLLDSDNEDEDDDDEDDAFPMAAGLSRFSLGSAGSTKQKRKKPARAMKDADHWPWPDHCQLEVPTEDRSVCCGASLASGPPSPCGRDALGAAVCALAAASAAAAIADPSGGLPGELMLRLCMRAHEEPGSWRTVAAPARAALGEAVQMVSARARRVPTRCGGAAATYEAALQPGALTPEARCIMLSPPPPGGPDTSPRRSGGSATQWSPYPPGTAAVHPPVACAASASPAATAAHISPVRQQPHSPPAPAPPPGAEEKEGESQQPRPEEPSEPPQVEAPPSSAPAQQGPPDDAAPAPFSGAGRGTLRGRSARTPRRSASCPRGRLAPDHPLDPVALQAERRARHEQCKGRYELQAAARRRRLAAQQQQREQQWAEYRRQRDAVQAARQRAAPRTVSRSPASRRTTPVARRAEADGSSSASAWDRDGSDAPRARPVPLGAEQLAWELRRHLQLRQQVGAAADHAAQAGATPSEPGSEAPALPPGPASRSPHRAAPRPWVSPTARAPAPAPVAAPAAAPAAACTAAGPPANAGPACSAAMTMASLAPTAGVVPPPPSRAALQTRLQRFAAAVRGAPAAGAQPAAAAAAAGGRGQWTVCDAAGARPCGGEGAGAPLVVHAELRRVHAAGAAPQQAEVRRLHSSATARAPLGPPPGGHAPPRPAPAAAPSAAARGGPRRTPPARPPLLQLPAPDPHAASGGQSKGGGPGAQGSHGLIGGPAPRVQDDPGRMPHTRSSKDGRGADQLESPPVHMCPPPAAGSGSACGSGVNFEVSDTATQFNTPRPQATPPASPHQPGPAHPPALRSPSPGGSGATQLQPQQPQQQQQQQQQPAADPPRTLVSYPSGPLAIQGLSELIRELRAEGGGTAAVREQIAALQRDLAELRGELRSSGSPERPVVVHLQLPEGTVLPGARAAAAREGSARGQRAPPRPDVGYSQRGSIAGPSGLGRYSTWGADVAEPAAARRSSTEESDMRWALGSPHPASPPLRALGLPPAAPARRPTAGYASGLSAADRGGTSRRLLGSPPNQLGSGMGPLLATSPRLRHSSGGEGPMPMSPGRNSIAGISVVGMDARVELPPKVPPAEETEYPQVGGLFSDACNSGRGRAQSFLAPAGSPRASPAAFDPAFSSFAARTWMSPASDAETAASGYSRGRPVSGSSGGALGQTQRPSEAVARSSNAENAASQRHGQLASSPTSMACAMPQIMVTQSEGPPSPRVGLFSQTLLTLDERGLDELESSLNSRRQSVDRAKLLPAGRQAVGQLPYSATGLGIRLEESHMEGSVATQVGDGVRLPSSLGIPPTHSAQSVHMMRFASATATAAERPGAGGEGPPPRPASERPPSVQQAAVIAAGACGTLSPLSLPAPSQASAGQDDAPSSLGLPPRVSLQSAVALEPAPHTAGTAAPSTARTTPTVAAQQAAEPDTESAPAVPLPPRAAAPPAPAPAAPQAPEGRPPAPAHQGQPPVHVPQQQQQQQLQFAATELQLPPAVLSAQLQAAPPPAAVARTASSGSGAATAARAASAAAARRASVASCSGSEGRALWATEPISVDSPEESSLADTGGARAHRRTTLDPAEATVPSAAGLLLSTGATPGAVRSAGASADPTTPRDAGDLAASRQLSFVSLHSHAEHEAALKQIFDEHPELLSDFKQCPPAEQQRILAMLQAEPHDTALAGEAAAAGRLDRDARAAVAGIKKEAVTRRRQSRNLSGLSSGQSGGTTSVTSTMR